MLHASDLTATGPQSFCTEASTIGLKPGEWPDVLATSLGNKQQFVLIRLNEDKAVYRQSLGIIELTVFND